MPVIAQSTIASVTDLAATLATQITDGRAGRATLGTRDVAFDWTTGAPPVLARFVANALIDGLSFTAVTVKPSATKVAKVVEGGTKPNAVTLTSGDVPLSKYAGLATFSTERAIATDSLVPAVYACLISQALLAYDADAIAALSAAAAITETGTSWTGAILAGYAAVATTGALPDLLVMSGADYAAALEAPGSGYTLDPTTATVSLFGMRICVSAAATPGTAYVLPAAAVLAVENTYSPIVVCDPFSGLATNEVRLAAELFAGVAVTSPGQVAKVTVTPAP